MRLFSEFLKSGAGIAFGVLMICTAQVLQGASIQPLSPVEALTLLPQAPDGWKLVTSIGSNDLTSKSELNTTVTRLYENASSPGQEGLVKSTAIKLVDVGSDESRFEAFKRPPLPGRNAYVFEGVPVQEGVQGSQRMVYAGFAPKFILIVTATNQNEDEIKAWLQRINFANLLSKVKTAPKNPLPSGMVDISYVDEINPKNNRTNRMSYLTDEEAAALAAEDQKAELDRAKQSQQSR